MQGEWELLVICRVTEQYLPFQILFLKMQLDYGAQMTEVSLWILKMNVRTYILVNMQISVVSYTPGLYISG